MVNNRQVWGAIDALAARYGFSVSGLAREAGLDPTTFNKSKRVTAANKPRWPNMESVAKAIEACGATFEEFSSLVSSAGNNTQYTQPIPLIGFAQAGVGGFFDDGGFPVGGGWEHVRFPEVRDESAYGLEVSGDSMEPLYRDGDILIVSPHSEVRRGDRVVVKTSEGEVMAKELVRKTASRVELASMNPEHATLVYKPLQLEWMARIVWVSQ